MTDVLIRDVPEEVLAALDADANRMGLSRSEYLRRALAQAVTRVSNGAAATVEDLTRFGRTFRDLDDDDVMRQAWQ